VRTSRWPRVGTSTWPHAGTFSWPRRQDRRVCLPARLRNSTRTDLGVHADVVERARNDGHGDRARLRAVRVGPAEVAALARGDDPNNQPQHEQKCSDTHEGNSTLPPSSTSDEASCPPRVVGEGDSEMCNRSPDQGTTRYSCSVDPPSRRGTRATPSTDPALPSAPRLRRRLPSLTAAPCVRRASSRSARRPALRDGDARSSPGAAVPPPAG